MDWKRSLVREERFMTAKVYAPLYKPLWDVGGYSTFRNKSMEKEIIVLGAIGNNERENRDNKRVLSGGYSICP